MKKYNVIYADPPWKYSSGVYQDSNRIERMLCSQYSSMDKKEIENLPIENISDKDCALFLWVTDSHLKDGIELMEKWGFSYKTIVFIWTKKTKNGITCANIGAWTMKNCEICIFGTKGNMLKYKKINNIYQLVEAERTNHSKKPEEVRNRIDLLFGNIPKIELFARENAIGWDVFGDEVENSIEFESHIGDTK